MFYLITSLLIAWNKKLSELCFLKKYQEAQGNLGQEMSCTNTWVRGNGIFVVHWRRPWGPHHGPFWKGTLPVVWCSLPTPFFFLYQSLGCLSFRSGSYRGSISCYSLCHMITNLILTATQQDRLSTIIIPLFIDGETEARRC